MAGPLPQGPAAPRVARLPRPAPERGWRGPAGASERERRGLEREREREPRGPARAPARPRERARPRGGARTGRSVRGVQNTKRNPPAPQRSPSGAEASEPLKEAPEQKSNTS